MMTTRTLFTCGVVLVICLAIFASVSSSSSMSSTPQGRNTAAASNTAAERQKDRLARTARNEVTGKNEFLRSFMQPAGLPGTKLFSLLAPQAPGPETIATYAEDCTT